MSDPYIFDKLDGTVHICQVVLEELDKHKTRNDEVGKNIREFSRNMASGIYSNIRLIKGHTVGLEKNDIKIILTASEECLTLLTNDNIMYITSMMYNVVSELIKESSFRPSKDELFDGMYKTDESVDDFVKNNQVMPNSYILASDGLHKVGSDNKISRLRGEKKAWNIKPLNLEQKCVMDALMNPDIKLVTVTGSAGSGKTLLAVAAMFEQTLTKQLYEKMLISRPVVPMGNDIGYLPGTMEEKLSPWLQPIFDNIEVLLGRGEKDNSKDLIEAGILEIGALTYIRGRSIPNQIILIDESQNLSKHELITILTRVGEGTKVVLTGDINQIDSPKLDSVNNGLSYVIDKFKDQPLAAHITLKKCERSELAEISCKIL